MPMVITNTLKRHAGVEAAGTGKNIKKKKKIRKKPLAEAETAKIPAVRRRRLSVFLIGPQLAAICPSSCDTDPAYIDMYQRPTTSYNLNLALLTVHQGRT
jgi:hypothetical protein